MIRIGGDPVRFKRISRLGYDRSEVEASHRSYTEIHQWYNLSGAQGDPPRSSGPWPTREEMIPAEIGGVQPTRVNGGGRHIV